MLEALDVSAEVRQAYRDDGVVCTRGVVSPDAARTLLQQAMAAEKTGDRLTDDMNLFEKLAGYWECVAPLPALAAELTGSKRVRFYNDHLFIKHAGASAPTRWHQDLPFWPFAGNQIVAAWIALTPVRKEASAVQYLRGSHLAGHFYQPTASACADPNDPGYLQMEKCPDYFDDDLREGREFLSWDMEPGDVLWHHPLVVHGAYANAAPTNPTRAGLTARFLGDDAVWDPRPYVRLPADVSETAGQRLRDDGRFPIVWPEEQRSETMGRR